MLGHHAVSEAPISSLVISFPDLAWNPAYPDFPDSAKNYQVVASGMMPGVELT